MITNKKQKGQYFTKNAELKKAVHEFIRNEPAKILEPSMGRGDLVEYVSNKIPDVEFDLYEIDEEIEFLESVKRENICIGDFLSFQIPTKYDTIIGNPPYVKTKKGNLYIDFIEKCFNLLNEMGELIFIVPSDFIKLTSSGSILNKMTENGTFTDIFRPNNEKMFEDASIDVMVFRYCKNKELSNKISVNGSEKYLLNINGVLTFSDHGVVSPLFSEYFDVYVGMVSGREEVFKNEKHGNIEILNDENKKEKYILINKFRTKNEELNQYMLSNKESLINRKIRKFTNNNWFEWGALRNFKTIQNITLSNTQSPNCIYVKNVTRSDKVCFIAPVQLFGGGLIAMIPKKSIDLAKVTQYINSTAFKSNYTYSGRFKIGHRQLRNSLLYSS
uniref:site-specific DNA-methyltransferase (adenine-specific) n=1 Tax=viral metagenome TaxID=1070528 RepID=A0A6C0FBN5_9ZZZZ|tara:strand:+ start:471 stop:1634 length:1164 start_codon:yes stop_codon:yes gene_type:complete